MGSVAEMVNSIMSSRRQNEDAMREERRGDRERRRGETTKRREEMPVTRQWIHRFATGTLRHTHPDTQEVPGDSFLSAYRELMLQLGRDPRHEPQP